MDNQVHSSVAEHLHDWHEKVLTLCTRIVFFTACPLLLINLTIVFKHKQYDRAFFNTTMFFVVIIVTFIPQLGFQRRVILLIGSLYVASTYWFLLNGLVGTGRLYWILVIVLSVLLLKRHMAILMWMLCTLTIITIGVLFLTELLPPPPEITSRVISKASLISYLVSQILVSGAIGATVMLTVERLHRTLAELHQGQLSLQQLNQELEDRVVERTASLYESQNLLNETQRIAHIGGWKVHLPTGEVDCTQELYHLYELDLSTKLDLDLVLQSFPPESRELLLQAHSNLVEKGIPYSLDLPFVTAKGTQRWMGVQSMATCQGQDHLIVFGTLQDITERKQFEEQLQHLRNLAESANRAKSIFLANMSHELRTPLNAILGFSQIMGRSRTVSLEYQKYLEIINRSGQYLLMLINNILDLSKIESGHMMLNEKPVFLKEFLADIKYLFQLRIREKQLELRFDIAPNLPAYLRTDEIKLRQILVNLLSNAVKFTSEGQITLRVRGEDVQEDALPNTRDDSDRRYLLHISVEDTGPGIAPVELDRIFEAFVQASGGRQEKEGTGLGLTISRKFVQLMGGDLTVQSEEGKGSNFTFTIVTYHVDAPNKQFIETPRQVLGLNPGQPAYRILIVDDHADNRQLLAKVLAPLQLEIRESCNGQEALAVWETWEPHIIFMDVRMPVMDGYAVTHHIKSTPKGPQTIIVAVTASVLEEERKSALDEGCDDFIRKPFRDQEIFEVLSKHLGLSYYYASEAPVSMLLEVGALTTIPHEQLENIPIEELTALEYATILGDIGKLEQCIERIRVYDESLSTIIYQFVDAFAFERLSEAIEKVLQSRSAAVNP